VSKSATAHQKSNIDIMDNEVTTTYMATPSINKALLYLEATDFADPALKSIKTKRISDEISHFLEI